MAHLAVHEELLHTATGVRDFIGIAEVCAAPAHRGRGLVGGVVLAEALLSESQRFPAT